MEEIWTYTIKDQLLCDAQEHPILLAEPSCGSVKDRERACEMMFENLQVPALFLAKNAALSSFSTGKNTAEKRRKPSAAHPDLVCQKGEMPMLVFFFGGMQVERHR